MPWMWLCSKRFGKIKKMKLTATNVNEILMDCLYDEGENQDNAIKADGVRLRVGLNPERLESHKAEIIDILNQLPDEFKEGKGGGYSFINACMTAEGEQWGEHNNIDELLCLGIAIDKVKFQFPRDMWSMFPGGMPYFVVKNYDPREDYGRAM